MKGYIKPWKVGDYWYSRLNNGKSVSGKFRTRDDCERACKKLAVQVDEGTYRADSKMTIEQLCRMYRAEYLDPALKNVRDSTARTVNSIIKKHIINSMIANTSLCQLNKPLITGFKNHLTKNVDITVPKNVGAIYNRVLLFAVDLEIITHFPRMSFKRGEKVEKILVGKDKLFEMLRGLDPYRGLVVGLMGRVGLRISEVYALKVEDVDFERKNIFVRRRQYNNKIENYTKTATSYCNLPVYDEVLHLIRRFIKWESGWIFPGINYNSLYRGPWKEICKTYELPKGFTPHSLRHSFGYILLKDNINVKAIQRLMRHKNITTTLNEYGHYLTEDLREDLDRTSNSISNFDYDKIVNLDI